MVSHPTLGAQMENLRVHDSCEEVRVEICGNFSGASVDEVQSTWTESQSDMFWRRFVIDISGLTGYDADGFHLLHEMHRHGALFAASTPNSLVFLEEITSGQSNRLTQTARRGAERSVSPRPRHRAGVGIYEPSYRYR
jgi:hypothetical protein